MTEFMELAIRRLIFDQKLPFEPVALDDQQLMSIIAAWNDIQLAETERRRIVKRPHKRQRRE